MAFPLPSLLQFLRSFLLFFICFPTMLWLRGPCVGSASRAVGQSLGSSACPWAPRASSTRAGLDPEAEEQGGKVEKSQGALRS